MRQFFASALEVVEVAVVALGAVYLIRNFLVQPFLVSGASMSPTFENGDYLLIDELSYRLREPQRGEVVVFRYPRNETTYFIKRIVGLPGEQLFIRDGGVEVMDQNGVRRTLDEEYLPRNLSTMVRPGGQSDFRLGPEEYLVLGDNRSFSYDSREWGILAAREIVGLVRFRLWPLDDFGMFAAPTYQ